MAKYMLLSGKHVDQESNQTYSVPKGAAPVAIESRDALDKMFPGKFVRAAVVERGRRVLAQQADEDPGQQDLGLKEGSFISPEAAEIIEAAKAGEADRLDRQRAAVEAGETVEAAKAQVAAEDGDEDEVDTEEVQPINRRRVVPKKANGHKVTRTRKARR